MHFDATGSLVRAPEAYPNQYKRILNYVLVIKPQDRKMATPVAEMISSSHDQPTVLNFMSRFFHEVQKTHANKALVPRVLVIDRSWPMINSAVYITNKTDLIRYLNFCHRYSTSGGVEVQSTIYLCAAHNLKSFIENMKFIEARRVRRFYTYVFVLFTLQSTLKAALALFRCVCICALSKQESDEVTQQKEKVGKAIKQFQLTAITDEELPNNVAPDQMRDFRIPMYRQSPFL